MRFRALVLAVSLAGALPLSRSLWQPARAANPPVDAGLLEFLGSVDSDDQDWHQYLGNARGTANMRPVHNDPADPPAKPRPAGNPAAAADKPSGNSSSPSDSPPAQHSAPDPSQPGASSPSNGQSSPPGVNHT